MQNAAAEPSYEALQRENARFRERVAALSFELSQLRKMIFGARSERFEPESPDQLGLFGQEAARPHGAASPTEKDTRTTEAVVKKKPVRSVLPTHLPRRTMVIEPDIDTTGMRKIGQEVTETLDYVPAKLVVLRRERPKYETPEGRIVIADLPARPIDKGIAEPGLLAHVVASKYLDHMPLYRQAQQLARQGITIATSTMGDWVRQTADLLVPVYDALIEEARTSGYIQADETPIRVQDSKKDGDTHRGWKAIEYRRGCTTRREKASSSWIITRVEAGRDRQIGSARNMTGCFKVMVIRSTISL